MSNLITTKQLNSLKSEFRDYLREKNSDWEDTTISTYVSDAFFAFNNDVDLDFWASLTEQELPREIRDRIRDYLRDSNAAEDAEKRADRYLAELKRFKEFLDDKHPTLASEWSGKSIRNVSLQSDFRVWMKKQKQSNGQSYSPNTINTYVSALKTATAQLQLGNTVFSNLFYYITSDEFEVAHRAILAAPNFSEIETKAGNKAYSSAMVLYARFLKEFGEPSAWMFQGNPKRYDIVRAIEDLDKMTWAVSQYNHQIRKGDKVYIWKSGKDGGIISSGTILCDPETKQPNLNDQYARGTPLNTKPYLAVDIQIEKKLTDKMVARQTLLSDERTKKLEILTFPRGTNFRVTEEEATVIESIIDGTYKPVPLVLAPPQSATVYSEAEFLNEVYMSKEQYATLKGLLLRKKNIILQGPPGVGKTFVAQRLAFSVIGAKDTSQVQVIQFHQSYTYEDFIMGYRPNGNGFSLVEGPFYRFCKIAESDTSRPYFFIIDEINRGNLSKIFGELLMLTESDKRGKEYAVRLLYKDELFYVPANVYIIGMMNTADRSLAMIDYALRRRFAFFNMEPAFDSEAFREHQKNALQNPKFEKLINTINALNGDIARDASLGSGFRIGHSYLCTNDAVDDAWLHDVVEYELLPLLNEYWFDEPTNIQAWTEKLRNAING